MEPQNSNQPQGPKQSDIAQKAAERRAPVFDPTGKIEGLTAGETLIADIRRHIIGLVILYLQFGIALVLSLGLIIILLPTVSETFGLDQATANNISSIIALFTITLGVIFLILAHRIYITNQLIISDKSVTQVAQVGLFHRKVSELTMGNIEDVTAHQKGILPTVFNYGTLHIETAGEQNNFIFLYCPNPNAYAKAILDSRLAFMTRRGPLH